MSPASSALKAVLRENVTDCHVHVFESPLKFPFQVPPAYEPPLSPVGALLDEAASPGISRFVLVQPTPYGDDLSLLKTALEELQGRGKGVGVVREGCDIGQLARMREQGVVALRFVEKQLSNRQRMPGTVPLAELSERLGPMLKELGMHAEIWVPLSEALSRWRTIERCGIPTVLDHMGGFDPKLGTDHRDFQRLLALVREGAVWVKLAICRRAAEADYEAIRPFHEALVEANSHQVLWATDFPFVRFPGRLPKVAALFDRFCSWVRDETIADRILVRNPASLYHF